MLKFKFNQKIFLVLITALLLITQIASAQKTSLDDITYTFNKEKIEASVSPFYFLRSFVDLFYLVSVHNKEGLTLLKKLSQIQGWCAGDAHAENFGYLLQENGSPLFTINDIDDSGPCPVVYDLYRLLVGSKLYNPASNIEPIIEAYINGLKKIKSPLPNSILDMKNKAVKKGTLPNDKKVQDNQFIRTDQMSDVEPREKTQILKALSEIFKDSSDSSFNLLDLVATRKIGGGSGGLLRYEVLLEKNGKQLHLEFKEQVKPSIYPVATTIPDSLKRISTSLNYNQGKSVSKLYRLVQINSKEMLVRPRFAGNIGVKLEKQSIEENQEILQYEANILGNIHSQSISSLENWKSLLDSASKNDWNTEIELMSAYFNKKYKTVTE